MRQELIEQVARTQGQTKRTENDIARLNQIFEQEYESAQEEEEIATQKPKQDQKTNT
jgi:hypothetical protein